MSGKEANSEMSINLPNYRPGDTVITLPDPDQMPTSHDEKGTMQWRTGSHKYPNFEIHFVGPNPEDNDLDKIIYGDETTPVVIKLNKLGEYSYTFLQLNKNRDRGSMKGSGITTFRVQSCGWCYP